MYQQIAMGDSVKNTELMAERIIVELTEIQKKLNDLSLRLARIEAKKGK